MLLAEQFLTLDYAWETTKVIAPGTQSSLSFSMGFTLVKTPTASSVTINSQ